MKRPLLTAAGVLLAGLAASAAYTRWISRKVEREFRPEGGFIHTRHGRLHVIDRGSGPTILMIHGLGGQTGNFTYGLVDRLAERYRVVAVDRPGCGFSDPLPEGGAPICRQAEIMAEVIRKLELDRPLVVGHSLGGAIALALAIDHPELVRGLCLLAPLTTAQDDAPPAFQSLKWRRMWQRRLIAHTLAAPMGRLQRKATLNLIFGPDPAPDDFGTKGLGYLSMRPMAFITASSDMVFANDDLPWLAERYGDIAVPVSVLYGRGDQVLHPEVNSQAIRQALPGARIEMIEGGHMIPLTAWQAVAEFIDRAAQEAFA